MLIEDSGTELPGGEALPGIELEAMEPEGIGEVEGIFVEDEGDGEAEVGP